MVIVNYFLVIKKPRYCGANMVSQFVLAQSH